MLIGSKLLSKSRVAERVGEWEVPLGSRDLLSGTYKDLLHEP